MKRILVCGVPNSNNLGDRIIAESVNFILKTTNNNYEINNFDFTEGNLNKNENHRIVKLNSNSLLKKAIPNSIRRLKVRRYYNKNIKLYSLLKSNIDKSDIIVIGGGHLLIDNYLSFPIGIKNVIELAKLRKIPVIFAFVGAKGPWSKKAKNIFLEALHYAERIAVRDSISLNFLLSIDPKLNKKIVSLSDPALFVSDFLEDGSKPRNSKIHIGLGIMDPFEMRRHCSLKWKRETATIWWVTLAKLLVKQGFKVNVFTNGSATDNGFVEYFIKKELLHVSDITFSKYPASYLDVLNIIKEQDIVIAQRLHACLPAISYGKQTFGIKWDIKLKSIFQELNLSENIIDFNQDLEVTVNKIINKIEHSELLDQNIMGKLDLKKKEMIKFVEEICR